MRPTAPPAIRAGRDGREGGVRLFKEEEEEEKKKKEKMQMN